MELSICAQCGRHIEPTRDKPGWRHVAGYRPRHIARPTETTMQPDTPMADLIDPKATLRAIQDSATDRIAQDLASLLNRARELGVVVCADVDADGTEYSIESARRNSEVWWSSSAQQWKAGERTEQDEIDDANHDPRWGKDPAWRCWIARHGECDPNGPEAGCTCACHSGEAERARS